MIFHVFRGHERKRHNPSNEPCEYFLEHFLIPSVLEMQQVNSRSCTAFLGLIHPMILPRAVLRICGHNFAIISPTNRNHKFRYYEFPPKRQIL